MKFVPEYNLWWPDFEEDPLLELKHIIKRVPDCDKAMKHVRANGIAVQAGGHCGLYARQLAKYFALVHVFEPVPDMYECLGLNVSEVPNIVLHPEALAASSSGTVLMGARAGGRSKVDVNGHITAPIRTIDSLSLARCDLIYLDIEGYEIKALAGATKTIEIFRPTIVLEVLDGRHEDTSAWADRAGYRHVEQLHADWVFIPK